MNESPSLHLWYLHRESWADSVESTVRQMILFSTMHLFQPLARVVHSFTRMTFGSCTIHFGHPTRWLDSSIKLLFILNGRLTNNYGDPLLRDAVQGPEEGRGKTNFPGQAGWSRWGRKCKSPVRRTDRRDFEVPNSLSTAVGLGFNFKIACYEAREAVKSY